VSTDTDTDTDVELTDRQARAVDLMLAGLSDSAVAEAIGAHRSTVCKWRHGHHGVAAALARARAEAHAATLDRVQRLQLQALEWADNELRTNGPHAARVALTMLDGVQRLQPAEPPAEEVEPRRNVVRVRFNMG
jgi:hypothetical protein